MVALILSFVAAIFKIEFAIIGIIAVPVLLAMFVSWLLRPSVIVPLATGVTIVLAIPAALSAVSLTMRLFGG